MAHITTTADALELLAAELRKVRAEGEHVFFEEEGHPIAALIPIEDLNIFKRLVREEEDRIDNQKADQALSEPGLISLEDIRESLGI